MREMENKAKRLPVLRSIVVDRKVNIDNNIVDMKYSVGSKGYKGMVLSSIEPDYDYYSQFGILFLALWYGVEGSPKKAVKYINFNYVKEFEVYA